MSDDWKYQCDRCGEVVSNFPCRKPWAYVYVHRDPNVCIRYISERVAMETEARVRQELAAKGEAANIA